MSHKSDVKWDRDGTALTISGKPDLGYVFTAKSGYDVYIKGCVVKVSSLHKAAKVLIAQQNKLKLLAHNSSPKPSRRLRHSLYAICQHAPKYR